MNPEISNRELTSEDARKLRIRLIIFCLFLLLFGAVLYFMLGSFPLSDSGSYVFFGVGILLMGIPIYMVIVTAMDFFKGEKQVIKGLVTDKQRHKSRGSRTSGGGGRVSRGRRSRSSSSPKFYLFFGDKKYHVDQAVFDKAKVGSLSELHYARHSGTSLDFYILEEAIERPERQSDAPSQLRKKEVTMDQSDLLLLKKARRRTFLTYLSFTLFFGLMLIPFLFAAMLWWVMVIPVLVIAVLIFAFVRIGLKKRRTFLMDEQGQVKVLIHTSIIDKSRQTGSSRGFYVKTGAGNYQVSGDIYESTNGKEEVILSIGKHSGCLLNLVKKD